MIRNTAIEIVKSRLGNIQGTAHDQTIINNMILAQTTTLEGADFKPWFLLKTDQSITTVDGTREYAPPTGFLQEEEESEDPLGSPDDENLLLLPKKSFQELAGLYGAAEGQPVAYSFAGEKINFFPRPDDAYTIIIRGFYRNTSLETNVENDWLTYAADFLIAETCRMTALDLQYEKLVLQFEKEVAITKRRLFVQSIAREEAGRTRQMGGQ